MPLRAGPTRTQATPSQTGQQPGCTKLQGEPLQFASGLMRLPQRLSLPGRLPQRSGKSQAALPQRRLIRVPLAPGGNSSVCLGTDTDNIIANKTKDIVIVD